MRSIVREKGTLSMTVFRVEATLSGDGAAGCSLILDGNPIATEPWPGVRSKQTLERLVSASAVLF